jgi:hypothetical protein
MATLNEALRTGEFIISEASGTRSREEVAVVSGAGALVPGTVLGIVTASSKYAAYDNDATDGTQVAKAVLYAAVDATSADAPAVVIARDAEVAEVHLTGIDAAGITDLAAVGVIVR